MMHLQGIKTRVTLIVGSLLLVSMLLVNLVLVIFWQRDALQRETVRDQAVLARVLDRLPASSSSFSNIGPMGFSFIDFYPAGETGRILLFAGGADGPPDDTDAFPLLQITAADAMRTGEPVLHYSSSFLGLISFREHVLVNALPIVRAGKVVGSIAVARSLKPMLQSLWQAEKVVLAYIFINLLVLVAVGFFRMTRIVVQPIERLVRLADQYQDRETALFTAGSPGGEFGQLAFSLNSMLARIENDRKALETSVAELEAANEQLKTHQREMIRTEKLASVGRMAAGLAHEIGNPLGVVQGYLGLLEGAAGQSADHLDFIKRANQELQRVNALIRQMLDFARVSKGEPESFSLHELLLSTVEMVEVQPVFDGVRLECRLQATRDMVYVDRDRLRQVFVNCLLNSADAIMAAERGDDGCVTVSTNVYGPLPETGQVDFLCIQISDNGVGIAAEQQTVIFDPFYTTKEPGKGTGLGLSVSLSIIESMGGRMDMKSDEGQGSVLSVFLPLQDSLLVSDHDHDYSHSC